MHRKRDINVIDTQPRQSYPQGRKKIFSAGAGADKSSCPGLHPPSPLAAVPGPLSSHQQASGDGPPCTPCLGAIFKLPSDPLVERMKLTFIPAGHVGVLMDSMAVKAIQHRLRYSMTGTAQCTSPVKTVGHAFVSNGHFGPTDYVCKPLHKPTHPHLDDLDDR